MLGIFLAKPLVQQEAKSHFVVKQHDAAPLSPEQIYREPGNFILYPVRGTDEYEVMYYCSFYINENNKVCQLSENADEAYKTFKVTQSVVSRYEFNIASLLTYIDSGLRSVVGVEYSLSANKKELFKKLNQHKKVSLFFLCRQNESVQSFAKIPMLIVVPEARGIVHNTYIGISGCFQLFREEIISERHVALEQNYLIDDCKQPYIDCVEMLFVTSDPIKASAESLHGIVPIIADLSKEETKEVYLKTLNAQFELGIDFSPSRNCCFFSFSHNKRAEGKKPIETDPLIKSEATGMMHATSPSPKKSCSPFSCCRR